MPFKPEKYRLTSKPYYHVGDLVCHRVSSNRPSMWLVIDAWYEDYTGNQDYFQYVKMMSLDTNRIVKNPIDVLALVEDVQP